MPEFNNQNAHINRSRKQEREKRQESKSNKECCHHGHDVPELLWGFPRGCLGADCQIQESSTSGLGSQNYRVYVCCVRIHPRWSGHDCSSKAYEKQ